MSSDKRRAGECAQSIGEWGVSSLEIHVRIDEAPTWSNSYLHGIYTVNLSIIGILVSLDNYSEMLSLIYVVRFVLFNDILLVVC